MPRRYDGAASDDRYLGAVDKNHLSKLQLYGFDGSVHIVETEYRIGFQLTDCDEGKAHSERGDLDCQGYDPQDVKTLLNCAGDVEYSRVRSSSSRSRCGRSLA